MTRFSAEGRRVGLTLSLLGLEAALVAGLAFLTPTGTPDTGDAAEAHRRLVVELQLTDPAVFSEASYCRHPSQADSFAPFADHPAAIEHFPAGSIVPPLREPEAP